MQLSKLNVQFYKKYDEQAMKCMTFTYYRSVVNILWDYIDHVLAERGYYLSKLLCNGEEVIWMLFTYLGNRDIERT